MPERRSGILKSVFINALRYIMYVFVVIGFSAEQITYRSPKTTSFPPKLLMNEGFKFYITWIKLKNDVVVRDLQVICLG